MNIQLSTEISSGAQRRYVPPVERSEIRLKSTGAAR
jgi:hypothetical protein